ncbi:MAG: ABC transporter transmembrane domain-containing protein, partial [Anaerolineales bacterium]|nr:ABC transporter transmembrane domain-containing protein [Anaerolineales bacterium]
MTTASATEKEMKIVKPGEVIDKPDDTGLIIRRLLGYMAGGSARGRFALGVIMRIIALAGLSVIPFLTGQAINIISESPGGTVDELQFWVFLALIAGTIYLVVSLFTERVFGSLATQATYKLQVDLFSHMQSLSLSFFDRQGRGELMSRLTNDTEVISLFYESAVTQIIRSAIQIVLTFFIMLVIDWR